MGRHPSLRLPCFGFLLLLLELKCNVISTAVLPPDEVAALDNIVRNSKGYAASPPITSDSCTDATSTTFGCNCSYDNNTICHVTRLNFLSQGLKGRIIREVANFTYLNFLDLSDNKLHGSIPAHLKNLPLTTIILQGNRFWGRIPSFLGTIMSLEHLDLSSNLFTGSIPAELGGLPSLKTLTLSINELSGPIPDALGNIITLQHLHLTENRLSGELPQGLGRLKNLRHLAIQGNQLTGRLPPSLTNLTQMKMLSIRGNNFSGRILGVVHSWKQILELNLIGNNFEGPFDDKEISGLKNLTNLRVADLTGSNEGGFRFPDISGLKSLSNLVLRNCSITGQIPEYIGLLTNLKDIDLSFNKLTGKVPESIIHLKLLKSIFLTNNMLQGSIPSWGLNATQINADFSHNNFTNLSFSYDNKIKNMNLFACCSHNATKLDYDWQSTDFSCNGYPKNDFLYINCGGNESISINGSIYEADFQENGVSSVYVSSKGNWAYSSTGDYMGLDSIHSKYIANDSCGIAMTDATLYMTARLSPLSLKYYGLCLVNGNYIVSLHFAEIVFTEVNDYRQQADRVFDVFIQGNNVLKDFIIKKEAGGPRKAVVKKFVSTVTDHRLEIHFYWAAKGSVNIPPALYGPLISAISLTPVPKGSGVKLSATSIVGIVGSAILLITLAVVFLWKMGWLGGKTMRDEEFKGVELFPGGFFNFQQIKAATQNFNSVNKIGEGGFGSVYKGVLPNGLAIAVKQLSSKSKQGIHEFVNEVGTISALQHPNLVRLLGCCAENNQLLLVYEYMENNSLSHVLFGSEELKLRLNWPTRFKICLGIAKGLAFLHEESKLKIVHRDIKPTNILLDKDLNAKISDFGLAKLNEEESTNIITKIAGTVGYMAPEYAMRGYLTNKADVYSFGIVALEIVSGKNNTSYSPNEETVYLLDMAYVLQQKGSLLNLIDPAMGIDYSFEEVIRVLNLAIVCTNPSPTLRPTMTEVVSILEGKTTMQVPPPHLPYLTDDINRAKFLATLSLSTHFDSTYTEGTSNSFSSHVERNEIGKLDTSL